jgi:hypothetical protein
MRKAYIYFDCSWGDIHKIQERFGLPKGVTVNGETCELCTIKDEDWELLKETERRGYIKIRQRSKERKY